MLKAAVEAKPPHLPCSAHGFDERNARDAGEIGVTAKLEDQVHRWANWERVRASRD